MLNVLAIIPARGGSKGVPNKNVLAINGKPLIQFTIEQATQCKSLTDIICSTDSPAIAAVCESLSIRCLGLRPAHLASDEAKTSDAIIYEVENYEKVNNLKVDIVLILQPTSPLRLSRDIDGALQHFLQTGSESLVSCYPFEGPHPAIMYLKEGTKGSPVIPSYSKSRRQDFQGCYVRNGAIYIVKRDFLLTERAVFENSPTLYEMPFERSLNIDSLEDIETLKRALNASV